MIMANNNSSNGNNNLSISTGELKKEVSSSNLSTISQSTNLSIKNTTTSSTEVKIESSSSSIVKPTTTNGPLTNSDTRWIFPLEKIENSPSRKDGVSKENELTERQEAALFINDLGLKLKVNQLCINTAIIYMHRFYMIHSLKKFHHYIVATSCLFFACKVEEQPRRLREFIDIVQSLFHKSNEPINHNSEEYRHYGDQIMALESSLIQTLGFNVLINHAHTVIIKTCQMIKAPRDLAEAAYLTATNSLILTDFCAKFSSEKVACFCIYLACKWTGLIIPMSSEGMQWYEYVNHDIKEQELEDISNQYLSIYGKCSTKIKKKLGITKNHDDINPQLHPKHGQQQQVRKPMNPSQYTNPNQRPQSNPNQLPNTNMSSQNPNKPHNPHNNPHQQQQLKNPTHSQNNINGFHPSSSNQHQHQQRPQQQQHHPQRPQGQNVNNPNKVSGQGQGPPFPQSAAGGANHPNNHNFSSIKNNSNNPVQTSKNNIQNNSNNPNSANHNSSRPNFSNGTTNGPSSTTSQSHLNQSLNNQSGASSGTSTKSNINNSLNLKHDGDTPGNLNNSNNIKNQNHLNNKNISNNGQQNINSNNIINSHQIKKEVKREPPNVNNYKQMIGNTNGNTNLNLMNNRSSPINSNSSMKRGNEELSNSVASAPNKIPKYVVDQKSAS